MDAMSKHEVPSSQQANFVKVLERMLVREQDKEQLTPDAPHFACRGERTRLRYRLSLFSSMICWRSSGVAVVETNKIVSLMPIPATKKERCLEECLLYLLSSSALRCFTHWATECTNGCQTFAILPA
jgi:hypothetical protein